MHNVTGIDEAVDRLVSRHQGAEQNDQDDGEAGEVLDPAVAVGEGRRRLLSGERKRDPQRNGCASVGDVVDGIGEQLYDDKLQCRGGRQNQERPFDRPDASGGGGDARVYHAMGVAMSMVVFGVTMVAAV
jgi:hypothetical protein